MSYFPESNNHKKNKIKHKLDFYNYATKFELKGLTGINTSKFAKKTDLANLKSDVDDLHIDKLKTVAVDLSKLSDVVKSLVVEKTVYNKLIKELLLFRLLTQVI